MISATPTLPMIEWVPQAEANCNFNVALHWQIE
jgi:hypothetical protein